jgi:hypothetical protein
MVTAAAAAHAHQGQCVDNQTIAAATKVTCAKSNADNGRRRRGEDPVNAGWSRGDSDCCCGGELVAMIRDPFSSSRWLVPQCKV